MADEQQRTPEFKPEDEIDELFSRANLILRASDALHATY